MTDCCIYHQNVSYFLLPGPYSCTKSAGCLWKNFNNITDWGYYDKTNSDCETCRDKCEKDSVCKAFECGTSYCSWWAEGTCDDLRKANVSSTAHETCRILGIYICGFWSNYVLAFLLQVYLSFHINQLLYNCRASFNCNDDNLYSR